MFQLKVGPVIKGIAKTGFDSLRPGCKFFFGGSIAGNFCSDIPFARIARHL